MKVKPLHDRVIAKRIAADNKTPGGLHIPDTAQEKPQQCDVVAVGNGKLLDDGSVREMQVKVGDRVLIGKYNGAEITLAGETHLVVRESEILGVIED